MRFRPEIEILRGVIGAISGVIVIVGSLMLYGQPRSYVFWGTLIIIFSTLSLITVSGGLIVGFILGLIGGILGLTRNPRQQSCRAT